MTLYYLVFNKLCETFNSFKIRKEIIRNIGYFELRAYFFAVYKPTMVISFTHATFETFFFFFISKEIYITWNYLI